MHVRELVEDVKPQGYGVGAAAEIECDAGGTLPPNKGKPPSLCTSPSPAATVTVYRVGIIE